MHTHTCFSHDSQADPEEVCKEGIRQGLFGLAFTDHLDCEYYENPATETNIDLSFEKAKNLRGRFRGNIMINAGAELGDALFCPALAEKMTKKHDWDVILLSVHAVRMKGHDIPFSQIDFGRESDGFINDYLTYYFNDLLETVNTFDYDVLSHLTVPLRYIVKKYGRNADVKKYYPVIREILKKVVSDGKTLEINTSGYPFLMPDGEILSLYRELGGEKITIGSDAHVPQNVSFGLRETAEYLYNNGFDRLIYYHKRTPHEYYLGQTK